MRFAEGEVFFGSEMVVKDLYNLKEGSCEWLIWMDRRYGSVFKNDIVEFRLFKEEF